MKERFENIISLLPPPYYKDDWCAIYHGDCRELLPLLPDKSVDLVLTDPPYGMKLHKDNRRNLITGDDKYPIELIPILEHKSKKALFAYCRWCNLPEVKIPKSFIAVVKPQMTSGDLYREFGRAWEGLLFYPQEQFSFNRRLPDVIDCRRVPNNQLIHETQKPEYPIMLITQECSALEDIILDPFLGSGTTAYCAKKLNRCCIGIEIEEKYCEIAAKRCSQQVMELSC